MARRAVDKVEDGRYDITYDDGDEEFGVERRARARRRRRQTTPDRSGFTPRRCRRRRRAPLLDEYEEENPG